MEVLLSTNSGEKHRIEKVETSMVSTFRIGRMRIFISFYIGMMPVIIPTINMTIVVPTAQSKVKR